MGLKLTRDKPRHLLLSLLYRLHWLPLARKTKFKLFLDLEWIFSRLSNDISLQYYNAFDHPWRRWQNTFLLDRINPSDRVLDLGCAMGDVTAAVAARANYTVGVELKEELIAVARERHKGDGLEFICMDAVTYLSSEESGFDVLILSHILEHIEEPEQFLRKFSGFFKRVYIEVPDFDASLLNHYRQDLNLQLNYCDPDHVSEFDRNEIQEILDRCGLDVEATEYIFGVQRYWCKVIKA